MLFRSIVSKRALSRLSERGEPQLAEVPEPGVSTPVKRIGSHTIGAFPFDPVRIECERCSRAGRYALAGLIGRFGLMC